MAINQFMPLYSSANRSVIDPYQSNVILALDMEDSPDGFTLVDKSGYNNTFQRGGNAHVSTANKKFGLSAAAFDGNGDFYYSPLTSIYQIPGDFTIEYWFYMNEYSPGDWSALSSHATASGWSEPTVVHLKNSGTINLRVGNNINWIVSTPIDPRGKWTHISYGRTGTTWYFYVNGVLQGTRTNNSYWTGWSCTLGTSGWQRGNNNTDKLNGYIDEFRWWKGVSVRNGISNFTPPTAAWSNNAKRAVFSTPGGWSLIVPNFSTYFQVDMWGGGGGGGPVSGGTKGQDGTATTCTTLGMTAGGGEGGDNPNFENTGAGGTASGGNNVNANGEAGEITRNGSGGNSGRGGSAPYGGGLGGKKPGNDSGAGQQPGGGGAGRITHLSESGTWMGGRGGGSGAYCQSVYYSHASLVPGTLISGAVGQGGRSVEWGGDGRVSILWD